MDTGFKMVFYKNSFHKVVPPYNPFSLHMMQQQFFLHKDKNRFHGHGPGYQFL